MIAYLITAVLGVTGGFVQAITGFGAGIIIMLALPGFLPMNIAPTVSNIVTSPLTVSIALRYKRYAVPKLVIVPAVIYLAASTAAIRLSMHLNLTALKMAFGFVLIALAVYFMLFSGKIQVKGSFLTALVCCAIAGFLGGFFGIGGPTLAIYFLSVTKEKEEYLGTLNLLFVLTNTYQVVFRAFSGLITAACVPYLIIGTAAILIGSFLGGRVVGRINGDTMKKVIYIFLAFAGAVTAAECIL